MLDTLILVRFWENYLDMWDIRRFHSSFAASNLSVHVGTEIKKTETNF